MLISPNIAFAPRRPPEPKPNTYTFSGSYLQRTIEALQVARHQARQIEPGPRDRWLDDALGPLEDGIAALLTRLRDAVAEDEAEAAELGEVRRLRIVP